MIPNFCRSPALVTGSIYFSFPPIVHIVYDGRTHHRLNISSCVVEKKIIIVSSYCDMKSPEKSQLIARQAPSEDLEALESEHKDLVERTIDQMLPQLPHHLDCTPSFVTPPPPPDSVADRLPPCLPGAEQPSGS